MKRNRILGMLALVAILALLVVAIPATPALALTFSCDPDTGAPGTTVTVYGTGYTASDQIRIDFNWMPRVTATVSPTGVLSTSFTVPNVGEGIYQVQAYSTSGMAYVASDYFTVVSAEIEIDPEEGPVGTEVEISGEGFDDREDITVEYDGDEVDIESGDYRTDTDGEFQNTTIIIPESIAGDHTITVIGEDSDLEAEAEFTVEEELIINPDEGPPGTEVTVTGTGFGNRSDVTIYFDGDEVETDRTSRYGSFTATFTVPALAPGKYDIEAEDDDDNTADADFTIIAANIGLNPTSGKVGTGLTVTGTGFTGTVTIKYDGVTKATATASAGAFSATFNAPASASGAHTVAASDSVSTANASFTVSADASLSQTTGYGGDEVTVSGTGFRANQALTIAFDGTDALTTTTDATGNVSDTFTVPALATGTYDVVFSRDGVTVFTTSFEVLASASLSQTSGNVGTEITVSGVGFTGTVTIEYDGVEVATTTADDSGAFSVTFSVPASTGGEHIITARDETNSLETTFTMESEAPPVLVPLLPEAGGKAKAEAYFDWEDVSDPSGVTYTLQIASNENFTEDSIVLEREGLTESEYTLTEEERLESTKKEAPYYWRVKAVDRASNESEWSTPASFHVGFSITLPDWAMYVIYVVGAVVVGFIGFWFGRRTTYSY